VFRHFLLSTALSTCTVLFQTVFQNIMSVVSDAPEARSSLSDVLAEADPGSGERGGRAAGAPQGRAPSAPH
jgi:hypothetical protein